MSILLQVFEVVIIPILGVLTTYLVKLINAKISEISEKRNSEIEKKYLSMLNETITECVLATTQTYVDTLKKEGNFDLEAQKAAFNQTYEAVVSILSKDAKEYFESAVGDFELFITKKIEMEVNLNK
jgi:hypothetical protein